MRLFVAILFSEKIRQTLCSTIAALKKQVRHGSFTRLENLHLTLAFLGETERLSEAKAALTDAVAAQPGSFPLALENSGRFGDLIWAGVSDSPALSALAYAIQDKLREQGFSIEKRVFRPHITLARRIDAKQVRLIIPHLEMFVESISLMKSERIDGRLTYTEVHRISL